MRTDRTLTAPPQRTGYASQSTCRPCWALSAVCPSLSAETSSISKTESKKNAQICITLANMDCQAPCQHTQAPTCYLEVEPAGNPECWFAASRPHPITALWTDAYVVQDTGRFVATQSCHCVPESSQYGFLMEACVSVFSVTTLPTLRHKL